MCIARTRLMFNCVELDEMKMPIRSVKKSQILRLLFADNSIDKATSWTVYQKVCIFSLVAGSGFFMETVCHTIVVDMNLLSASTIVHHESFVCFLIDCLL
mmetsp:Transcript_31763/g.36463  ORF Transcript_31763/g.36463 Transcript_31763/m.36463 type:complete len:100 (-) Transcript_31763:352-651(-)